MALDSPRLLHRRSEHGYTEHPYQALADEPEAVSREIQRGLTEDAHLRREAEIRGEWMVERTKILEALARLRERPWAKRYLSEIRALERGLDQLNRKI